MSNAKKKIVAVILLLMMFLGNPNSFNSTIYAEINQSYTDKIEGEIANADDNAGSGTLLGLLAICIVSFGSMVEWLTGWIMAMFSGSNFFPWADKIIFNTVPMVDINFINPAKGSLFRNNDDVGSLTKVGEVIRSVYFTGLSISLSFLGIIVAVMAIRLALSSIAADKAKYKEAVVTWLMAMVLLFGMHYVISFVFYLNEKMVEVASEIVKDNLGAVDTKATLNGDSSTDVSKVISTMGHYFKDLAVPDKTNIFNMDKCKPIPAILYTVLVIQSLMFLFAYLKRFFYVVILAVLAPFIVVYDFLGKAMG